MLFYILSRMMLMGPMLLGISVVSFFAMSLAPGEPFAELSLSPDISGDTIKALQARFGLEAPVWRQYVVWLSRALRGDLGTSLTYNMPVLSLICSRAGNTLLLTSGAMLLAWLVAMPLGVLAAVRQRSRLDRVVTSLCYAASATPPFFMAICLLFLVVWFGLPIPLGGATSIEYAWMSLPERVIDRALHLLIPAFVLGITHAAGLLRYMRASMLDVLKQEYIVTARAKGVSEPWVVIRHACRNAANPVITLFGLELGGLLSGAALTEAVTGWPGLGTLILSAVNARDNQLVLGSLLAGGMLLLLGNLVADLLLALANPRLVRQ